MAVPTPISRCRRKKFPETASPAEDRLARDDPALLALAPAFDEDLQAIVLRVHAGREDLAALGQDVHGVDLPPQEEARGLDALGRQLPDFAEDGVLEGLLEFDGRRVEPLPDDGTERPPGRDEF